MNRMVDNNKLKKDIAKSILNNIISGDIEPNNDIGNNGNLYIQLGDTNHLFIKLDDRWHKIGA